MTPYPNQPERQSYGGYLPRNPYAGFWRRVLAYVIDGIVVGSVLAAIQAVIDALFNAASPVAGDGGFRAPTATGWFLVITVAYWLYFAVMESSSLQATVGKLAVGVRVT